MTAAVLRKIEAEIRALIEKADAHHPVDTFELGVIARKVGAQAEIMEKGLAE